MAACIALLAGCGGSSSVTSGFPPGGGPTVGGTVSMPNGQVAAAPSMLERVASALVARVEALVGNNVRPVGGGVAVRLFRIDDRNVVGGQIRNGTLVFQATTDADGAYSVRLPTGTTVNTCRFYLEVGSSAEHTLTRAFVDGDRVNIDFESEATVRLLLEQINAGTTTLCDLSANEIKSVNDAVVASNGQVFGETASAVNSSATLVAGADPSVQAAIALAIAAATPTPVATDTAAATLTSTATATVAPPTSTGAPATRTSTNTRVVTRTPVPTDTPAPPSRTPTHAATATDTVPLPTLTNTPASSATATNTTAPTQTAPVPTGTATRSPTGTATVLPSVTATAPTGQIEVGIVAGTAGGVVSVPVSLMANGATIAAVSTDIEFDGALVNVAENAGAIDCSVDARLAGQKQVFARVNALTGTRKLLRVGVIGPANNTAISSGPLFACRFVIDAAADGSVTLMNTPEAAGPQAQSVGVVGINGRIDVTAAPAELALSAGTAAAGGVAVVTASLRGNGQALAAVATDIQFDTAALAMDGAEPDCTIDAAIAARGKELVVIELPGDGGQAVLRVGVIGVDNNTALSDSEDPLVLFQCRFAVQPAASGTIMLPHSPEGAAPDALPVVLISQPGSITVQ